MPGGCAAHTLACSHQFAKPTRMRMHACTHARMHSNAHTLTLMYHPYQPSTVDAAPSSSPPSTLSSPPLVLPVCQRPNNYCRHSPFAHTRSPRDEVQPGRHHPHHLAAVVAALHMLSLPPRQEEGEVFTMPAAALPVARPMHAGACRMYACSGTDAHRGVLPLHVAVPLALPRESITSCVSQRAALKKAHPRRVSTFRRVTDQECVRTNKRPRSCSRLRVLALPIRFQCCLSCNPYPLHC